MMHGVYNFKNVPAYIQLSLETEQ
jgi:hypothetical protein